MDEAVCRCAFYLPAGDPLHCLGAPIGAHVVEAGGGVGNQRAQQHGNAVHGVVFRGEGRGLLGAVPVEGGGHDGFGEIAVGQPVRPLALSLEAARHGVFAQGFLMPAQLVQGGIATARHGVFAQGFLMPAQLVQGGIAKEDVLDDAGELGDKFPILVRGDVLAAGDDFGQFFARVAIEALFAVLLDEGFEVPVTNGYEEKSVMVYPIEFKADEDPIVRGEK